MHIGPYELTGRVLLAPMAGVTDRPFRLLCRELGAALAVSEMVTADTRLWHTDKTRWRLDHRGEAAPRSVQIAGAEPVMMAKAARLSVDNGADIIDINMGCPAKKVCRQAAGSALLRDELLVARILEAVVAAVEVPVTLKIRTGWDVRHRNAVRIAAIAEQSGIQALTVHGRTRACGYRGEAEYDTIAEVKARAGIPVIANGDIDGPLKARRVLDYTNADALMIGRAAQGRPWIFGEINHYLTTGELLPPPAKDEVRNYLCRHLRALHAFYGERQGVRIARKHIGWYSRFLPDGGGLRRAFNRVESAQRQLQLLDAFFIRLNAAGDAAA